MNKLSDLFGRYSLPNVMGRLGHRIGGWFHHDTTGYDSSGINPGGNPFGGPSDFTNGYSIGSGSPFDIGNGFLGGQQYDPFTGGTQTPVQHTNPFGPGTPAPVGGGGPSQTTNGFSTAFRGGGDVYDPADYVRAMRLKGGDALR